MVWNLAVRCCCALLLLLAAGCGGGGSTPPSPARVGSGTYRPAPQSPIPVGNQPSALAAGDWNGDGHLDLAAANHLSGTLNILLGAGNGGFVQHVTQGLLPGRGAFEMRAGYLDADAHIDLAIADATAGSVSLHFGQGDGTFSTGTALVVPGADDVMGVALGDLDDDGVLDIVATARDPGLVASFLGHGDGTFASPAFLIVGYEARQTALADLDEDGALDLLVSVRSSSQLEVFLGLGDGTFTTAPQSPLSIPGLPWAVAAADFDGDGACDVAAPGDAVGAATLLLGNADGTFVEATQSPLAVGAEPYGVAAGDLDGDRRTDLVVANFGSASITLWLGSPAGLRAAPVPSIAVGAQPFPIVLGDFDEDGVPDIAVGDSGGDTVTVLLGIPR